MKVKNLFLSVCAVSLLSGCNKDDDIINDGYENPDYPAFSLDYKVVEYLPAPGQYINEKVSGFDNIYSMEDACRQAEKRLSQNSYVSLGAWGGYIVVKFDNKILNSGKNFDFSIGCNAFDSSSEPGIVWVMQDTNGNGKPDDTWYELKGSYYDGPGYQKDYLVTYYRPEKKGNTEWIDSEGDSGQVNWVGNYHNQDYYYPNWVKEDSYTLHGTRLPLQAYQDPDTGNWTNLPFEWGYADNFGSDFNYGSGRNYFLISNAIDSEGNPVDLPSLDFIKVQTAVNGSAGWLGENSTEVTGFYRN